MGRSLAAALFDFDRPHGGARGSRLGVAWVLGRSLAFAPFERAVGLDPGSLRHRVCLVAGETAAPERARLVRNSAASSGRFAAYHDPDPSFIRSARSARGNLQAQYCSTSWHMPASPIPGSARSPVWHSRSGFSCPMSGGCVPN